MVWDIIFSVINMYIFRIQDNWLQKAGSGPLGPVPRYYNLFYFPTSVNIISGDEIVETKPGACVLSAPRQQRGFCFPEDTIMQWFHADEQLGELIQQYDIPLGCVLYPDNPAFIPELFRKMYREFNMNNPYREELMDGYTRELLIKLSRSIYSASTLSQIDRKEQEKLQQLRYRIISNPERRWTVEEMAKSVSLSVSRFHAVYKQLFGGSPMKDVIAAKVELAKSLLLMEENMTVSEVTERLGYRNQQHFIRQFKATTGLTPGDYRMNNR